MVHVMKFNTKSILPYELWETVQAIKHELVNDSVICIPNDWDFYKNVDLQTLKDLRNEIDNLIGDKK